VVGWAGHSDALRFTSQGLHLVETGLGTLDWLIGDRHMVGIALGVAR